MLMCAFVASSLLSSEQNERQSTQRDMVMIVRSFGFGGAISEGLVKCISQYKPYTIQFCWNENKCCLF